MSIDERHEVGGQCGDREFGVVAGFHERIKERGMIHAIADNRKEVGKNVNNVKIGEARRCAGGGFEQGEEVQRRFGDL